MKKQISNSNSMVIGMCLGISVGTAIGAVTHNMGMWIPVGLCTGMCIGSLVSLVPARKQDKTCVSQHVKPPKEIGENIWQFTEGDKPFFDVNAYLIIGDRSALLVDALQSETGMLEEIRKLTDKPLEVLITHGHRDHAGNAVAEFHEAGIPMYMNHQDYEMIKDADYGMGSDWLTDLKPGHVFDLGNYRFEILPVEGHTKGSVAALDREHQLLFSGDSIGSGNFWMQLPGCSQLHVFREDLEKLAAACADCPDLLVFPGHRSQSPVQLTGQYVKDTLYITNGLLDGSLKGEPASIPWNNGELKYLQTGYGQMVHYCYNPNNL